MINNIITAVVVVMSVCSIICVAAIIQTIWEERK